MLVPESYWKPFFLFFFSDLRHGQLDVLCQSIHSDFHSFQAYPPFFASWTVLTTHPTSCFPISVHAAACFPYRWPAVCRVFSEFAGQSKAWVFGHFFEEDHQNVVGCSDPLERSSSARQWVLPMGRASRKLNCQPLFWRKSVLFETSSGCSFSTGMWLDPLLVTPQ